MHPRTSSLRPVSRDQRTPVLHDALLADVDKKETVEGLVERIEAYEFKSEALPLGNCHERIKLRRRLKLPPTFKRKRAQ
jgi:hypothetical protein